MPKILNLYDFVVIGGGVAGESFLFETALQHLDSAHDKTFAIVNSSTLDSCSLNSTAIVSTFGTEKGISPLGDLVVDSYQIFKEYFSQGLLEGVYKCQQYYLAPQVNTDEYNIFLKRHRKVENQVITLGGRDINFNGSFENSYACSPLEFLNGLKKISRPRLKCDDFDDEVISLNYEQSSVSIRFKSKKIIKAKNIIFACGPYFEKIKLNNIDLNLFDNLKIVPGSYVQYKGFKSAPNFIISSRKYNLVHRDSTLILGGTKNLENGHNYEGLDNLRNLFHKDWAEWISLPPLREGVVKTGRRVKGKKRMPSFGEFISSNCKGVKFYNSLGHYKNGYTYAFYASKYLSKIIWDKC